jgi:transglutaminase-like putative cysteine protease
MTVSAATQAPDRTQRSGTRRTLLALLACGLAAFPLKALLADTRWLGEAWLTMAIVVLPAALLRTRRAPGALDIWPGIILLIPWLTLLYLPHHAWHGFIPTGATFTDLNHLMDSLHHTTSSEVAPIHSTPAVRLVISALMGLLAALIDLIAVVGRRGALAGVPLLVVFTVSGAVPREPVSWVWFTFAAVGYLILLALDAADDLREWGRRISRVGGERSKAGLGMSAQRIGIVAIIAAIALPLLLPADVKNLLVDAFRGNGGGGALGTFGVDRGGTAIDPYINLKGQLERNKPIELMTVHVDGPTDVQPFYVRLNVLDAFTGTGWRASDHGFTEPVGTTAFPVQPASARPQTIGYQATVTISNLTGNLPVFTTPVSTTGLDADATWSPQDQLLLGSLARSGEVFTETVAQPRPTIAQLQASPATAEPDMSRWLQLPPLPTPVTDLVSRLTAGAGTSYDKARAIFQFFADPKNHFTYTLETAKGDSGNDLVDFLQHRRGFCQQFAGAMGVMLRAAGVPSRIVLGYMHSAPDQQGNFSVNTFDAHSWVEAFFPGTGWIPFDPTPVAGLAGGKQTDLPWAQHQWGSDQNPGAPTVSNTASLSPSPTVGNQHGGGSTSAGGSNSAINYTLLLSGLVIVVLIGIALVPAGLRWSRRRARLAAARRGDTDALWAELSDTAIDLGYVWSEARSPRQVADWLANDAGDAAPALTALATAVEQGRYARHAPTVDGQPLSDGLVQVTDRLWSRRSGRVRLRARLWPASLGWSARLRRVGTAFRKH